MDWDRWGLDVRQRVEETLGYLNFSSGARDPRFFANASWLFALIADSTTRGGSQEGLRRADEPVWRAIARLLHQGLAHLARASETFRHPEQAGAVLRLVFEHALPAYRQHHRDLLQHQSEEALYQPFFLARMCEAVLAEDGHWEQTEEVVRGALRRVNDFLGHRPVAVLETAQKIQPYEHEWVCPIPLYVRGAGVAAGRYHDVVSGALELLRTTDADLLEQAWFDLDVLDELSLDPRAYDFDHPVNRRPNHHFGGWDPHRLDNRGYFRRFVVQQVTLDALSSRVDDRKDLPREELLLEAAAVLAGTMLMGAGITGSRPETHDSTATLARLLPHIAGYRDAFYERLLERMSGAHVKRLRAEAATLKQPFGGARQHLNQQLARCRAEQLQHVHLALLYARMGYAEAAMRQARVVAVASARMRTQMECHLTAAHRAIDGGELEAAAALAPEIEDLLHRAIECGAMVDPWNILGFGGQFSLFPAVENSIPDHRVDELIGLIRALLDLYARLQMEAAAAGDAPLRQRLSDRLAALARWWDQFASTEVGDVEGVSGRQTWESAAQVAEAIDAWHKAQTAAGDVAFWRQRVQEFRSPKAFSLLAETLLDRRDLVAAMTLLVHWLSQAEQCTLSEGDYSFHRLTLRWLEEVWRPAPAGAAPDRPAEATRPWTLVRKFLDYLEANAEAYWDVPGLELAGPAAAESGPEQLEELEELEEEPDDLFSAAYENVTYRDTTDDGFEGSLAEGGQAASDFELLDESERINDRLAFLATIARIWRVSSVAEARPDPERDEVLSGWLARAQENREKLLELLSAVHRYRIPSPRGTHESLVEYDRRRSIKDALCERVLAAELEVADAARVIRIAMGCAPQPAAGAPWEEPAEEVLSAAVRGDVKSVRRAWPQLLAALARQPLLYVPVSRGGNPLRVAASRDVQRVLLRLLAALPRLGLLTETYRLLGTIQLMERNHPAGAGAITEFDRLFEVGCKGILQCLVASSADWAPPPRGKRSPSRRAHLDLINILEHAGERLLRRWLDHSRNIRISVMEAVGDDQWEQLQEFIERYGHDLFTQQFMNLGNLRAILHRGVEAYLDALEEEPDEDAPGALLDDLGGPLSRPQAARWLELTLEAVVENYGEYIDYNSTTTQSDRGEMLYTLLDFLRLEASYDRVAWNLKPVVIAHEVLIRCGRAEAAAQWQQAVAQRTKSVADEHLKRFQRLSRRYGMRLPSIADRLGERFVRPLAIDRLRALVRPAVEEIRGARAPKTFSRLEREVAQFTAEPGGVGFDVPGWLEALEEEVESAAEPTLAEEEPLDPFSSLPQVRLSRQQVDRQLDSWDDD